MAKTSVTTTTTTTMVTPWTKAQAANYLGVTVRTITRWMRDGLLPYSKIGPRVYLNPDDIAALAGMRQSED